MRTDGRRPRRERVSLSGSSAHGLRCRPRSRVAAVAAAPWQSGLRSRPTRGPEQAGQGRRRGGRRRSSTRSGRRAGQRVGGARGRPCGDPNEPVVHGEQHGGQGHAQEVGADRGKAQPSAAGALAQPGSAGTLATAAHAARAPHRAALCAAPDPPPSRDCPTEPGPALGRHASHAPPRSHASSIRLSLLAPSHRPHPHPNRPPNPRILGSPPANHHQEALATPPAATPLALPLPSLGQVLSLGLLSTALRLCELGGPLSSSTGCGSAH